MEKFSTLFDTSSNTTRLKTRNDQFTGKSGKFSTTFNAIYRLYGKVTAKAIQSNKDFYQKLNFYLNSEANKSYHEGKNVRHPKWKVPAFYGMTAEMKEQLSKKNSSFISAYETKWLRTNIKKYITANLK